MKCLTLRAVTIGVEFSHKDLDGIIKLVFGTLLDKRFQSMTGSYYRGAHAVMFIYDVSTNLLFWTRAMVRNILCTVTQESVALLVGNKTDRERQVTEEGQSLGCSENMCYEEFRQNSTMVYHGRLTR